jgi:two-component system, LytTR family, response regulator
MNLKCYVIDDRRTDAEVICRLIEKMPELELLGYETDGILALNKLLDGEIVADIVFLDVEMPAISGIEIAAQIARFTHVIFVTGFDQYARAAFDHDAIDYLGKPVSYQRFHKSIEKVKEKVLLKTLIQNPVDKGRLSIKKDRKGLYDFVQIADIVYIESSSNYLKLNMIDNTTQITYQTLTAMESRLAGKHFLRIHKTTIINLDKVKRLSGRQVEMSNGAALKIGDNYLDDFMARIKP